MHDTTNTITTLPAIGAGRDTDGGVDQRREQRGAGEEQLGHAVLVGL
jgi:hypothetical protein